MLISGLASETPIAGRGLGDGNFNVVGEYANFRFDPLEEQIDQPLFGLDRSPLNHADLNDCVPIGAARWREKVLGIKVKKAMGALIGWKCQHLDDTGVDGIREATANRLELRSESVDFDLWH